MAAKRPDEPADVATVAKKPRSTVAVPLDIGPSAGEDDFNIKVMTVTNTYDQPLTMFQPPPSVLLCRSRIGS